MKKGLAIGALVGFAISAAFWGYYLFALPKAPEGSDAPMAWALWFTLAGLPVSLLTTYMPNEVVATSGLIVNWALIGAVVGWVISRIRTVAVRLG